MLGWGQKKLRSDRELRQVRMHVIVEPAGLLGRLCGRPLRFRVDRFSFAVSGKQDSLQQVEVEADSLVPECEVRKSRVTDHDTPGGSESLAKKKEAVSKGSPLQAFEGVRFEERVPLTISESSKLIRRTRGYVLDVPRYPSIQFDVEADEADSIQGTLHLHGESHPVACAKGIEGTELLVRCPVSMKQFGVTPFGLWLGLFSVADTVLVETRVPATALRL